MYQNLIHQNPIINQFNGFVVKNTKQVPFQNNQLINNNVHVVNNLNNIMQDHRTVKQNISNLNPKIVNNSSEKILDKKDSKQISKQNNLIEEMLKPQKISKENNNRDVNSNFKIREEIQKNAKKKVEIEMTNAPYKTILKDKIITKAVEDVREEDLVVHKIIPEIDANKWKFKKELKEKEFIKDKINDQLKIEFNIDNYDKHKKKF